MSSAWALNVMETASDGPVEVHAALARAVGGLVSAFALTEEPGYLERAVDLLRRLVPAFQTPTGLPHAHVNLWGAEASARIGATTGPCISPRR